MPFTYREHYAAAPLTDLVRKVWVMDNAQNPQPFSSKTVLPNGCFNLALVTGEARWPCPKDFISVAKPG